MPYLSISIKTLIRLKNLFLFILLLLFIQQAHSQDFWEQLNFPDTAIIKGICVNNDNHIYVGTKTNNDIGYLYKSTNSGENWSLISSIPDHIYVIPHYFSSYLARSVNTTVNIPVSNKAKATTLLSTTCPVFSGFGFFNPQNQQRKKPKKLKIFGQC